MRTPPRPLPIRCVLAVLVLLTAAGLANRAEASGSHKRDPTIAVRVHAQVFVFDPQFAAKVKVGVPPKEFIIEKLASISERDILSFYPYKAADGSFSVVIQLDRHGAANLESMSAQDLGRSLVVAVNGRAILALKVDKPISDGVLYIPYGLTETDIRAMGASFPIMGQTEDDRATKRKKPVQETPLDDGALPVPGGPNTRM